MLWSVDSLSAAGPEIEAMGKWTQAGFCLGTAEPRMFHFHLRAACPTPKPKPKGFEHEASLFLFFFFNLWFF